jgi:GR25 family glycosyltransferase involved in LPS biosynthesis
MGMVLGGKCLTNQNSDFNNMKINCINLKRSTHRKEKIFKNWKDFEIDFFEAVDKKDIKENGDIIPYLPKQRIRELNYGERACATSHYLLLKKLLQTDDEWFYIIEDDAICSCDPTTLQQDFDIMKKEFPLVDIFLMSGKNGACVTSLFINGDLSMMPLTDNGKCWGAYFYIINRQGAKQLMTYIETMELPIDLYWSNFISCSRLAISHKRYAKHIPTDTYIHPRLKNYIE